MEKRGERPKSGFGHYLKQGKRVKEWKKREEPHERNHFKPRRRARGKPTAAEKQTEKKHGEGTKKKTKRKNLGVQITTGGKRCRKIVTRKKLPGALGSATGLRH